MYIWNADTHDTNIYIYTLKVSSVALWCRSSVGCRRSLRPCTYIGECTHLYVYMIHIYISSAGTLFFVYTQSNPPDISNFLYACAGGYTKRDVGGGDGLCAVYTHSH